MQLIISVLILFILINCVLKLSFWRIWQAALFGAVCGAFVIATYPYAILQSKTQLADYLQNTTALQKYGRYHHARIGRLLRLLHRRACGVGSDNRNGGG